MICDVDRSAIVFTVNKIKALVLAVEAEGKTVLYSLKIARKTGFNRLILETDCLLIVHSLKSKFRDMSSIGMLTEDKEFGSHF